MSNASTITDQRTEGVYVNEGTDYVLTIAASGSVSVKDGKAVSVAAGTLINDGSVSISGGQVMTGLYLGRGTLTNNGTVNAVATQNNASFRGIEADSIGDSFITNAGVVSMSSSGSTSHIFGIESYYSGAKIANSGQIIIASSGSSSESFGIWEGENGSKNYGYIKVEQLGGQGGLAVGMAAEGEHSADPSKVPISANSGTIIVNVFGSGHEANAVWALGGGLHFVNEGSLSVTSSGSQNTIIGLKGIWEWSPVEFLLENSGEIKVAASGDQDTAIGLAANVGTVQNDGIIQVQTGKASGAGKGLVLTDTSGINTGTINVSGSGSNTGVEVLGELGSDHEFVNKGLIDVKGSGALGVRLQKGAFVNDVGGTLLSSGKGIETVPHNYSNSTAEFNFINKGLIKTVGIAYHDLNGRSGEIVNSGSIVSSGAGGKGTIVLDGSPFGQSYRQLTNEKSGLIEAQGAGTAAILFDGTPRSNPYGNYEDLLVLVNHGTIKAMTNAIVVEEGSLQFENFGDISGNIVVTGALADIYLREGTVVGSIRGGQSRASVHIEDAAQLKGAFKGGSGDDEMFGSKNVEHFLGGEGNDTAYVAGGNDIIYAGKGDTGDDKFFGGDGDDVIGGGAGNDLIVGDGTSGAENYDKYGGLNTDGADTLFGATGDDTLAGGGWYIGTFSEAGRPDMAGAGSNLVWAGDGNDFASGAASADTIAGGKGDDTLFGGAGNDIFYGGKDDDYDAGKNDVIEGGDGNDTVYGGGGADEIDGGAGNDVLWSGIGNDTLTGGSGEDTFVFQAGTGDDIVTDFNVATDRLDISDTVAAITTIAALKASASIVTGGVLIDLGGGDSLFLKGLTQSDLDGVALST